MCIKTSHPCNTARISCLLLDNITIIYSKNWLFSTLAKACISGSAPGRIATYILKTIYFT